VARRGRGASTEHVCEFFDAEHPFVRDVHLGTTEKPKGILHTLVGIWWVLRTGTGGFSTSNRHRCVIGARGYRVVTGHSTWSTGRSDNQATW